MKLHRTICLVSALALAAGSAQSQTPQQLASTEAALNFLQRLAATYAVLIVRAAIDLTYDSLTIDSSTGETVVNGLVLRPALDWDTERACAIRFDRMASSSSPNLETLETVIEISGASIPAACFDPGVGAMLSSFGYPALEIERVAMNIGYHVPSSGASLLVSADIAEAADVTVAAEFSYFWFTGLLEGDDPEPVAYLSEAEVAIENAGIWERVSPMLAGQFGDLNALPQMVGPMLGQMLAQPGAAMGPGEQAFIENISAELARFVQNGDRIVLSLAPSDPLLLDGNTFETPQAAIAALQPRISGAPLAISRMVAPETLRAALDGGDALDEATRLAVGEALITGLGAPRTPAAGIALLRPMAEAWNAEAAALLAPALAETGELTGAYQMALRALAGDVPGAKGIADELEIRLTTDEILAAQDQARAAWPSQTAAVAAVEAAEQAGDLAALRRLAFDMSTGRSRPRDYAQAFGLATLAAAGGDRGAAALRDRIDSKFSEPATGARDAAWAAAAGAAEASAQASWTGGLAERVMTRYGTR
ncbi:MAG: hypothetical protein ACFBRM_09905 [Pikeienuella sp.]